MKVVLLKKATLATIVGVLVFFCAFGLNMAGIPVSKAYLTANKKLPIYSVKTDENKVAISFDAAWGPDKTRDIMQMCDSYGVKATFFLVGFWVEKYPEMVKEIYNNGFEIGLHSNTHPDMTKLSNNEIKQELTINIDLIETITGKKPTLFRPPFGYYNNKLLEICDDLGIQCIQWSVDSLDWKGLSASEIAGRVISKSEKGSIVLFHNNSDNIIGGLKMILEHYKQQKTSVVPIGELVYRENYKIDTQGQQIKI